MKKILFISALFITLCFFQSSAQTPSGSKFRYLGSWFISADTSTATSADSNSIRYRKQDSTFYFKGLGYWYSFVKTSSLGSYKLVSDSFFNTGYATRARLKQLTDSMSATINYTNWNIAYNRSGVSLTFTSSTFTFTKQDGSTLTASVPTFNQNTTGSAGSVSNSHSVGWGLSGSSFNGSAAITWLADSTAVSTKLNVLNQLNKFTGSSNIVSLGTIISGIWNGTAIADTYISSSTNWNTAYTNRITSASVPLAIAGNAISFSYVGTNLKLTGSQLNTIQDISTNSSPAFQNITSTKGASIYGITISVGGSNSETSSLAVGNGALASLPSGGGSYSTTAIGTNALNAQTTGFYNTAVGDLAAPSLTTASRNTFIGYGTASNIQTAANDNTFVGNVAGGQITGSSNVAIGSNSGNIGFGLLYKTTLIGDSTSSSGNYSNSTALGYGATVTASNQMVFGNSSVTANVFNGSVYFTSGGAVPSTNFNITASSSNYLYIQGGGTSGSVTGGVAITDNGARNNQFFIRSLTNSMDWYTNATLALTINASQQATFASNLTVAGAIYGQSANQYFGTNGQDNTINIYGYSGATSLISSNAGVSSSYNGMRIVSNITNANSLPAWSIDLGGNINTTTVSDAFTVGRKPNGGSWANFFSISSSGTASFSSLGTGTVYSNGSTLTNTNPSDIRLKNTVNTFQYGLKEIMQLQPKSFYYNSDSTKSNLKYGFIAQDVLKIMPDMVRKISKGSDYLGLETEGINVASVKAIQEMEQQIIELQKQVAELKSKTK